MQDYLYRFKVTFYNVSRPEKIIFLEFISFGQTTFNIPLSLFGNYLDLYNPETLINIYVRCGRPSCLRHTILFFERRILSIVLLLIVISHGNGHTVTVFFEIN